MLNLTLSREAGPELQTVPSDPGARWIKSDTCVVDAPPDADPRPAPDARWPADAPRTGLCGVVTPRPVALAGGGFRLYYTQILPREGFPGGACDYGNAGSRILSMRSADGVLWLPEPGVRMSPSQIDDSQIRVVSPDVVPVARGGGRLRMYFECCSGSQSEANAIRSAISDDGGLAWRVEPGVRWASSPRNFMAPRAVFLEDGRLRLYCSERGRGIMSLISRDDGVTFDEEPGVRIAPGGAFDTQSAFAPEILRLQGGGWLMFYAGYSSPRRAHILRAVSADGLNWEKEETPAIVPGPRLDAAKCSEMGLLLLPPEGQGPRYRLLYEACDGTAKDARGVWRILAADRAS